MLCKIRWTQFAVILGILSLCCGSADRARAEAGQVTLWHLPTGAIQPQAAVDTKGNVHLIYFKAGASESNVGDLYYVRMAAGQARASEPLRVNSRPDTAGSAGTVRTAQIAIGKGDRVHVVWNGLGPKAANGYPTAYQAYTRLNETGTAFEPQRDLITWARGLDGGGSVAADKEGNVYVAWHATAGAKDEAGRAVFVARSGDEGRTFAREKQANPDPTGACACCGMRAAVDGKGILYILYRAAGGGFNRDTMLLVSRDKGQTFTERLLDKWNIGACPMSTYSLAESENGMLAAWETRGSVRYTALNSAAPDAGGQALPTPVQVPGAAQKHPFVTIGANGAKLLVWTEGTGWQRGGALAWQVVDKAGQAAAGGRKPDSVPVWGLACAYARPDGNFVIVY